jgi:hypothetical protein
MKKKIAFEETISNSLTQAQHCKFIVKLSHNTKGLVNEGKKM